MPRTNLLALLLCICSIGLSAQTDFRFISKSSAEATADPITSGEKYERAKKIYDKLAEARGDRRFPLPAFKMSTLTGNVAFLEGDGLSIGLETKAYDICMSLGEEEGENAIAALLGHELTHFYEKHQWRRGFADAYVDLQVAKQLTADTQRDTGLIYKVDCETQADYLGNFLAYSAGYPVYEGLPAFYDKIYKGYELADNMKGYASREDRKKMATLALARVRDLIDVFEMANLLTAIGRYDNARAFYKHILIQYQGREIYNNLGVLTVLAALDYFTEAELKYRIPVQLDLNFAGGSKDGFAEKERVRRALLQEAIIYFDNATSMDPDYAPAYLNKACAYFLLGGEENLTRASFYADIEAQDKAALTPDKYKKTGLDAQVLLALIAERRGKTAEAKQLLTAIKDQSAIANYNLILMNGQRPPKGRKENGPEDEEIDGIEHGDIYDFTRNYRREQKEQELFGEIDFRLYEKLGKLKNSRIFVCRPPSGEGPDAYFHLTDPSYPGKTVFDGYKVGTPRKDITDEYGEPNLTVQLTNGEIIVYEEMLFILDGEGKVKRFANYFLK